MITNKLYLNNLKNLKNSLIMQYRINDFLMIFTWLFSFEFLYLLVFIQEFLQSQLYQTNTGFIRSFIYQLNLNFFSEFM